MGVSCLLMISIFFYKIDKSYFEFSILDHFHCLAEVCYIINTLLTRAVNINVQGAQWLSGRVLDSRLRGRGFEPHQLHCVVVLKQDTFILA